MSITSTDCDQNFKLKVLIPGFTHKDEHVTSAKNDCKLQLSVSGVCCELGLVRELAILEARSWNLSDSGSELIEFHWK